MGKKRGGLFDFNRDGKESIGEMYVAYQMYQKWLKRKEEKNSSYKVDPYDYKMEEHEDEDKDIFQEEDNSWRDYCQDGSEYGIDPEDFETEEEYDEAICEAREEMEEETITLSFSICNEEYERKERERAEFLRSGKEQFIPARYLTLEGDYLYAKAIKDHFTIPCALPDETVEREMEFVQILKKLARRDMELSLQVWDWCLKNFLPFSIYDDYCERNLCKDVILELCDFPEGFTEQLVCYLKDHQEFLSEIIRAGDEPVYGMSVLITAAIRGNALLVADVLFRSELKKAEEDWKETNKLVEDVIYECKDYEEVETIEYVRDNYLPLLAEIPDGMVQDEIPEWEKEIEEYIDRVEGTGDKYAYSRRNAWRTKVPDGSAYGLNPLFYQTEEEYLQAWENQNKGWRRWDQNKETPGTDPEQQETDENVYFYCTVLFPFSRQPYSFLAEDITIEVGDTVVVPVGRENAETEGRVVAVGKCTRQAAPYPIEKMKKVIRKLERGEK